MIVNTANKCRCCEVPMFPVSLEITRLKSFYGGYFDDEFECYYLTLDTTIFHGRIVYSDGSESTFSQEPYFLSNNSAFRGEALVAVRLSEGIAAGITETWIDDGGYLWPHKPTGSASFKGYVARATKRYTDGFESKSIDLAVSYVFVPPEQTVIVDDGGKAGPFDISAPDGSALATCSFERVEIINGVEQ